MCLNLIILELYVCLEEKQSSVIVQIYNGLEVNPAVETCPETRVWTKRISRSAQMQGRETVKELSKDDRLSEQIKDFKDLMVSSVNNLRRRREKFKGRNGRAKEKDSPFLNII